MSAASIVFINAVKGQAMRDMVRCKILASLTIAQAILESGWGGSGLTKDANNLFGIKKGDNWTGPTVTKTTREYNTDGSPYNILALFRKYDSWADSIADHTLLLQKSRYANLVGDYDYKSVCHKISADGYATDPAYPDLLIKIIEDYKLYEFDQEVIDSITAQNISERMDNMDIKTLQNILNNMGIRNSIDNQPLKIDGVEGPKTKNAKAQAKELLGYILK